MTKPKRGYAGVHPGTPVRVYRNKRKSQPPWSIQAKCRVPGTMNRHQWYVVAHAHALLVEGGLFRVYEGKGYVLGKLVAQDDALPPMLPEEVPSERLRYSSEHGHFYSVEQPGYAIVSASRVWLTSLAEIYAEGVSE